MKISLLPRLALSCLVTVAATAIAQDEATQSADGSTTVYRQVMPDGRIVYSDKPFKGMKIDQTIKVEQPIKGNLWSTEMGVRPTIQPQVSRTVVSKVNVIPPVGGTKTLEEATSDVIKAEMLLEDAKKRLEASGAQSANGSNKQQKQLAQAVADAEVILENAIAEREALRRTR